ncbi:MAG TPA: isochorismate synthase [Kofleriaceae bacterium]|nr:isochorismate synthase [Kofleriaceae bacterium]
MTAAAMHAGRTDDWADPGAITAGLAIAARRAGRAEAGALTFIAVPAPLTTAASIIDAVRDQPRVAWTSGELTLIGFGCARELRGAGTDRWAELVRGARELAVAGAVIGGEPVPVSALGDARPRWIGGAAFAPGAADRAPWLGFGDAWFMLPRWTYVRDGARAHLVLAVDARDAAQPARWHDELALHRAAFTPWSPRPQPALVELARASADEWREQVVAITDAIAGGTCSKIVAARTATIALAGAVRAADLLWALDHRHSDCVRVLVQPPGAGALVAATPERLVRRDGELVWCDALAGTRSIHPGALPPDAPATTRERTIADASRALYASAKERREHELVVQAIRDALADGAEVDAPAEPDVRVLRHVVHLCTPFRARLRAPLHVLELAARLHPTPAVGGTPREFATDWIRSREPVARGWYAAPVGWFDLDGNGELAVAIRSGVLAGNRAHLWAGAGIVAGSDPERELAETEIKLRAMLGALGVLAESEPASGAHASRAPGGEGAP